MDQFQQQELVCKECGTALVPGTTFCTNCGCPVSKPKGSIMFLVSKIAIAVVLCIVALVMVVQGNGILNGSELEFYREHLSDCKQGRAECVSAMYSSSNSYFYSAYAELVEDYDEMIAEDEADIAELEAEANGKFILAGVSVVLAVGVAIVPKRLVIKDGAY